MLAWAGTATIKKDGLTLGSVSTTTAETQMAMNTFGALLLRVGNTASLMLLSSVMPTTTGQHMFMNQ
jgi:hypothetical protein